MPPKVMAESPSITFSKKDLSSPKHMGRKMLKDLNDITQQVFNKSGQEVLAEAPRSTLMLKSTTAERKQQRRKIKQVRDTIQRDKEESASELVLQNRISWSAYDKIRKSEGLKSTRKRPAQTRPTDEPKPKRQHGNLSGSLQIDKER